MKTVRSAMVAALAFAACAFFAADALAQFGGGMPGGGRRGARMEKGGAPAAGRPAAPEDVTDVIEYRLALLQEDLKLTRGQERAWVACEERIKAMAADVSRERARMQSTMTMHAVEQVNHAADSARNRLAAWEEVASATKALYDGLTAQQKALADERFPSIISALSSGGAARPALRPEGARDRPGPGPAPGMETR